MIKNKKAIGGPLDLIQHFVSIIIAIALIAYALDKITLSPTMILVLAIVLIVLEVAGLVM